jgi:hypothetical protein
MDNQAGVPPVTGRVSCISRPFRHSTVDRWANPDSPHPFAPPALPGFLATTGRSAPVPPGTLPLQFVLLGGLPLAAGGAGSRLGATGSHVPHRSLDQARAAFMPDTAWAVSRLPPGSSRGPDHAPVSMSSDVFRHVISGSLAFAFLVRT